ncbi:MAG: chemotaxis protein, partial [Bacteroidota bacterium]
MASKSNILLESGTNELEIIEFVMDYNDKKKDTRQSFGINVTKVREIIRMPELTRMPDLPDTVKGVFNLRGWIIPVVDLSDYLYQDKGVKPQERKMIIAEFNRMRIGFIVDQVQRIHRISWSSIQTPENVQDVSSDRLSIIGIISLADRHVLMLDVEKIIADINPRQAIDTLRKGMKFENNPKAVVVEDSAVIRKMISDRMKAAGFEIVSYKNGEEAWENLSVIENAAKPDIIVTDVEMPRMDGYSLTKNIKAQENLKDIPAIIFSSMINEDILHKGNEVGADAKLSKP